MRLEPRAICAIVLSAITSLACGAVFAAEPQLPDFTGLWTTYREPGQGRVSGFGGPRADLPLTAEGKRRIEEYNKLLGPERANPGAYCVDYGTPTMMETPGAYPLEFIQKPNQLTIIYEVENETRRIYIGSRQLPEQERLPSRAGYSAGHWEGNVLVVKTTDLLDGADQGNHPHSDQATIEERFSLGKDAKGTPVLTYDATITDPVYYTAPVKIQRKYEPLKDGFIIPYRCPDEFWYALLDMRRKQLKEGKPVEARMSDVYKAREAKQ
ncbi:MAG TPA: hypothetical protein VHH11_12075 [Gammaproteobacteria bacterium]|jgi:hypothetical protein|nr:hypothetical protein [Gammaproteobacteria bacterium]